MKRHPGHDTPLIGITPDLRPAKPGPSSSRGEPILLLQQRYTRALLDAGAVPLVLPITSHRTAIEKLIESVDGLVISGGNFDIHPRLYGEESIEAVGQINEERTDFELELISLALKRDIPLFGVCGGAQAINVTLGGSLYQDIDTQIPDALEHQQGSLKGRGGHRIKIYAGTRLRQIVGRDTLEVNTTHHQAVKKLGRGLIVNAATEDGVIEGIESKDHMFMLGVQWHPEFLAQTDPVQRQIFASFVSACMMSRRRPSAAASPVVPPSSRR